MRIVKSKKKTKKKRKLIIIYKFFFCKDFKILKVYYSLDGCFIKEKNFYIIFYKNHEDLSIY